MNRHPVDRMADLRAEKIVVLYRRARELERRVMHLKATSAALTKARLAGHDVQDFALALIPELEATMVECARLTDVCKDLENEGPNLQRRLAAPRAVQLDLFAEARR